MCKSELFKLFNKLWIVTLLLAVFMAGCGHWDSPLLSRSLVSIAVTPANPTIIAGLTKQFTAIGTYSDGTSFDITTFVTWTSDTTAVATVLSTSGLASGLTAGTSTIKATLGAIFGSTILIVTAAPLVSIAVTPANPSIAKDTTQQFTAIGTYFGGTTIDITTSVTWTSGTTAVATVLSTSGLAIGIAIGTSTITATWGGISGSTLLTVTQASVNLRTAANYGVLAQTWISNSGTSTVTGDIGTISGTISGGSITVIDGTQHAVNDAATVQAQTDMGLAYNEAAARASTAVAVELGGTTLTPGVYSAGTLSITAIAPLILDGQDDPNAVFIIKASSTLTTTGVGNVSLIHGASWYNVFWVVGSSATLEGGNFEGTILAQTSISLGTGTPVHGRLLARDGSVTLLGNTISRP